MSWRVKGVLFVDYVRMLRAHSDRSWSKFLQPEDLVLLAQTIEPTEWYPMETFERYGIAILHVIAGSDLDLVRRFGHAQVAHVAGTVEHLVVPNDPRESLMRFQVYRRSFFDFEALTVLQLDDTAAELKLSYGMSPVAEEAASIQTQGFFEGLIELADGITIEAAFTQRSWTGDPRTVLRLEWRPADRE